MAFFSLMKAILARSLFGVHGFVSVWRAVDIKHGEIIYWSLAGTLVVLFMEGVIAVSNKNEKSMTWFSPSVFLYLCSTVPSIWIIELDLAETRKGLRESSLNLTNLKRSEKLSTIMNFEVAIEMSADRWARMLEQLLLVILIIGRWLLPKGNLTRDQLSQLLLVYIGMAADIVELFESFKEEQVIKNPELTYIILGMWTWSLMQFTLILTATKARKTRGGAESSIEDMTEDLGNARKPSNTCCDIDVWAILSSLVLQDGPFLCLRLLLIFKYGTISYMNTFFTCKNTLLVLLQIYRLLVVISKKISRMKMARAVSNIQYDHQSDEWNASSRNSSHMNSSNVQMDNSSYRKSNSTIYIVPSKSSLDIPKVGKTQSKSSINCNTISEAAKKKSNDVYVNERHAPKSYSCVDISKHKNSDNDKQRSKSDVTPPYHNKSHLVKP